VQPFDEMNFARPWIEGVAVVANLVSDAVFQVGGVSAVDVDSAVAAVAGHDRTVSATLAARLIVSTDAALRPSGPGADWSDGFGDALCALAGSVDFGQTKKSPYAVAVVGLPITRNEWDCRADVAEVSRLVFDGMGLTVACCWPAPGTCADLSLVARAGTLLALPDGRAAARLISARTGAAVVDVDLPLGFDGTVRFMNTAAAALGRGPRTAEYVQAELRRVTPRFEWVVPHSLLHRRVKLVGSATFVAAMWDFLLEVGCDVCGAALAGGIARGIPLPGNDDPEPDEPVNIVIGNADAADWCSTNSVPFLESGWPCRGAHSFYPRPSLGFDGAAAILQDVVNRMNLFEILGSWKHTVSTEAALQQHTSQGHVSSGIRPA